MKKKLLSIASVGLLATIVLSSYQGGTHTTLGNRTQSQGGTTGCFNCHGNQNSATTVTLTLMDGSTVVTEYEPGKTYYIIMAGSNTNSTQGKYGFQLTCANASGAAGGSFNTNGITGVAARANNTFLEHSTPLNGTPVSGGVEYGSQLLKWTAPAAGTGTVKFYAVLNAVNGNNGSDAGDQWNFGSSASITERATTSVKNINQLKGVTLFPNPSNGDLTVELGNTTPGKYTFQLTDMTGRVLQSSEALLGSGTNQHKADVSALSTGIYLMKVTNGQQETTMKFHKL